MREESVYIGKEVNSLSIVLIHQHVLRFIVSEVKVISKLRRFKVVFVNKIIALVLVVKARCLPYRTCRFTRSVQNILSTLFIREILKLVARSLFTLTISEYMTANVCLYLCFKLRIMYIKYTFFKLTITLTNKCENI